VTLHREQRIRRHAEFQEIYKTGARVQSRYCTLFVKPNSFKVGRLGIAATKKLGGAVQRNRAKRLIREIFRHNDVAVGFDVVVVPRREFFGATFTSLETDYRRAIQRELKARR
jgi:ribonuclease P protein component